MIRYCLVAALVLGPAAAVAQGFETAHVCHGTLTFPNEDGSAERYRMTLRLEGPAYRITSENAETGEVTEDTGICPFYLGAGCRHIIPPEEGYDGDSYDFALSDRGHGQYLYAERWADAALATTVLDCTPTLLK